MRWAPEIKPQYPTSGRVGRPPTGVAKMLRMYLMRQRCGLGHRAQEAAVLDHQAPHDFVGIDMSCDSAPHATAQLKCRRLLLADDLTRAMFEESNAQRQHGLQT